MNTTIYVLIMVLTFGQQGGGVIQQEFSSLENCEAARVAIAKSEISNWGNSFVRTEGCFRK